MTIKRIRNFRLLSLILAFILPTLAQAQNSFGEFIQINTQFYSIQGEPTWLLILRDLDTGRILPYVYEVRNNDNFWMALSRAHNYKITVSNLNFNNNTTIKNFCHLENKILHGESMTISIEGKLSRHSNTSHCYATKYANLPFPIVNQGQ
jgi:hypothetical protein